MSDDLVVNLRGLVLARPQILGALVELLGVDGTEILDAVKVGTALATLGNGEISEANVVDGIAVAFQQCAPVSNPLPLGTARALAHVLSHDQVYGSEVELRFREAGWDGPPTFA
jgi:hypothetical protein